MDRIGKSSRNYCIINIDILTFGTHSMCVQDLERRNTELEDRVQSAENTLASSQEEREQAEVEVLRIIEALDVKICDLKDLRQSLEKLVDK